MWMVCISLVSFVIIKLFPFFIYTVTHAKMNHSEQASTSVEITSLSPFYKGKKIPTESLRCLYDAAATPWKSTMEV